MEPALENDKAIVLDAVDKTMFTHDAPRPPTSRVGFERGRFENCRILRGEF